MKTLYYASDEPASSNETAPVVDHQILSELHDNVFFTKTERFIETFMYSKEPSRLEIDRALAKDCFASLRSREKDPNFNAVVQDMVLQGINTTSQVSSSVSKYSSNKFKALVTKITREDQLYQPLFTLLTYINSFFRMDPNNSSEDEESFSWIDKKWEKAKDPALGLPSTRAQKKPGPFLRRRFVITHKKKGLFSNRILHGPQLLPDLCLVLQPAKTRKSPLELYWKNVKVPIEVKLSDRLDAATACQMARYARAVKLEQFDRNIVFSVQLSPSKCRVFHWDAAACHIMEIDVHDEPLTFIQVIGRLVSMAPACMGYDIRFSNAGRVLAGDKFKTVLHVFPGKLQQFLDEHPADEDAGQAIKLDLSVGNPIFEARGLLFSRFTRVWEGREVQDEKQWSTGPLRVVKQNWADAERISEAFLCDQTNGVPSVASVLGSQVIEGTANYHKGITPDDILGVYRKGKFTPQPSQSETGTTEQAFPFEKHEGIPRLVHRVLVRMVFEQKGRSVFKVQDSKELLQATKDWVEGLKGLHEKGITHRDISSGNLLLGPDPNSRAFIIDLGLAYFHPGDTEGVLDAKKDEERQARNHQHLTGTLPFISHQILNANIACSPLSHTFYHDLESIFWVLVYLVLLHEDSTLAKSRLAGLLSTKVNEVWGTKTGIISDALGSIGFSGRFKDLAGFLSTFADACWDYHKKKRTLEFQHVIEIVEHALESLPPGSGEILARSDEPKRKRRVDRDDADHREPASVGSQIVNQEGDAEEGANYRSIVTRSGKEHGSGRDLRRRIL